MIFKFPISSESPLFESSVRLYLVLLLLTRECKSQDQATRVPGSDHLVLQTDFPYQYWRPSSKPYTPTVPSVPTTAPASYGFYYGESRNNEKVDASTWQMLPIQLPDDLVGALNEKTTRQYTTPSAQTYPTTATPQYGRYPGVTEQPHLFHPERLYGHIDNRNTNTFQDQLGIGSRPRYPQRKHHNQENIQNKNDENNGERYQISKLPSKRPNRPGRPQQSLWHQNFFDKVEPFMPTHLPQLGDLSSLPNMNSLSELSTLWPFGNRQKDKQHPEAGGNEYNKIGVEPNEENSFKLPFTLRTGNKKRRRYKRPYHQIADGQTTVILSTPPNHDNPQLEEDQLTQGSTHYSNITNPLFQPISQGQQENRLPLLSNRLRPMNNRKVFSLNRRRRPIRRRYRFRNRPSNRPLYLESDTNDPWEPQLFADHTSSSDDNSQGFPNIAPNAPHVQNEGPSNIRYRPNIQARRPFNQQRLKPVRVPDSSSSNDPIPARVSGFDMSKYSTYPDDNQNPKTDNDDIANSNDYGIIDRLTDTDQISSSVAIPGGMTVVAMALALFYFNFVWYPTPVVTARLIKLLSDAFPDNLLDQEKQKSIGEVYEVFRSLEIEYMQDPNLWQPSCKSRLVCQVHKELPGLWGITNAYEAVVKNSLATGPQGDENLTVFLEAAEMGNQHSDCNEVFNSCPMTPIPIRTALQKFLGILDEEALPTVVYS